MDYILIIIGLVTVALIVYLVMARKASTAGADEAADGGGEDGRAHVPPVACCGAHEVCDKIIYYDDEELDRFRGKGPDDYADAEIDEFREVLLTLQTHEVAGWLRSLALRQVEPPAEVRDEALMVVSEFREERRNAH